VITSQHVGDILVCRLSGRLDAPGADALSAHLLPLLEGDPRRVLLNLEDLGYISTFGLRVLVKAAKTVKAGGGLLKLCSAPPTVRKVLEISGMDQLLDLRDNESAGLGAFGPG
ncbi:MAG: STAS domain-containing protein, partial [Gammaproteobacteria bacterium]